MASCFFSFTSHFLDPLCLCHTCHRDFQEVKSGGADEVYTHVHSKKAGRSNTPTASSATNRSIARAGRGGNRPSSARARPSSANRRKTRKDDRTVSPAPDAIALVTADGTSIGSTAAATRVVDRGRVEGSRGNGAGNRRSNSAGRGGGKISQGDSKLYAANRTVPSPHHQPSQLDGGGGSSGVGGGGRNRSRPRSAGRIKGSDVISAASGQAMVGAAPPTSNSMEQRQGQGHGRGPGRRPKSASQRRSGAAASQGVEESEVL